MNRRLFNFSLLGSAVAFGATTIPFTALANPPQCEVVGNATYRYRLRYSRIGSHYSLWIRLSHPAEYLSDVAFTLTLASDAAVTNLLHTGKYVSRAIDGHVTRIKVNIDQTLLSDRTPSDIFYLFQAGPNNVKSKVRKFRKDAV